MATIGTFTKNGDHFTGHISTLQLSAPVQIKPTVKRSANAPDYRLHAHGAEIGAAWSKTSKDGASTFLSITLDDPQLDAPINCALFAAEDGRHTLVWSRR